MSYRLAIAALLALALFVSLPMLYGGAPEGGDGPFHIRWIEYFTRQFWSGEAYPRWLIEEWRGYGAPVFYFYPPLGYFIAAGLVPPPFELSADLRLVLAALLAIALSGITCFIWLAQVTTRQTALLGAALYLAAPYHVIVDLYVRTAYSELWAFVWFPLLFLSCELLLRRGGLGLIGLALSFASLTLTNLPSAEIGSFTPFAYLLARGGWSWRVQLQALAGMILGAALAGVALVPALALLGEVARDAITTAEGPYYEHFVDVFWAFSRPAKGIAALFNIATLILALTVWGLLHRRLPPDGRHRWAVATAFVGLIATFFMTSLSQPLWWLLSPLTMIQFPWRFNTVLALCSAASLAFVVNELLAAQRATARGRAMKLALIVWIGGMVALDLAGMWRYWPAGPVGAPRVEAAADRISQPQHLPVHFVPNTAAAGIPILVEDTGPKAPAIVRGTGRVAGWQDRTATIEAETTVRVVMPRLHFRGVDVVVDDARSAAAEPYGELGLVSFELEPGRHEVAVRQAVLPEQTWGIGVSATAALLLALILAGHATGIASARRRDDAGPHRARQPAGSSCFRR